MANQLILIKNFMSAAGVSTSGRMGGGLASGRAVDYTFNEHKVW
jgi:hypothetical protein